MNWNYFVISLRFSCSWRKQITTSIQSSILSARSNFTFFRSTARLNTRNRFSNFAHQIWFIYYKYIIKNITIAKWIRINLSKKNSEEGKSENARGTNSKKEKKIKGKKIIQQKKSHFPFFHFHVIYIT